jgi:hypothetical protein
MLIGFIFGFLFVVFLGAYLLPKFHWWSAFEPPDRALAYFALFLALALLFQQATDFKYTVIYMLSDSATRETIEKSVSESSVIGRWRDIMNGAYWLFIACALLSLVALIRSSIMEARNKRKNEQFERKLTIQEFREMKRNLRLKKYLRGR